MTWKKHLRVIRPNAIAAIDQDKGASQGLSYKGGSTLPEVYAGHPNRIQRYYQYEDMSHDSDISLALDTIADFCTQSEEQNDRPFAPKFAEDAQDNEVKIVNMVLNKWIEMNAFRQRLWSMFRDTIKNGDTFFLCDPETGIWNWVDHYSVICVKVDENDGKEPTDYVLRGLDYNKQKKYATQKLDTSSINSPLGLSQAYAGRGGTTNSGASGFQLAGSNMDQRQIAAYRGRGLMAGEMHVVEAKHVVHLSMSTGMDVNWPFGVSVLEPIYKTFKQKELLEDSIIIYRVQRAPERRVFYIDVGAMPPARAKAHIQSIKNELQQRRIPNMGMNGGAMMDTAYSPLSMHDDFFIAQSADSRGSKVDTLPGAENLGEIGDVNYFLRKLARGLAIPKTYLNFTDDQTNVPFNDGKLGNAVIEEFRFNKYCMRLQSLLAPMFDRSFKDYLARSGINIEDHMFYLEFNPPQNFTKYRQIELDAAQVQVFQQVSENKLLSARFKLRRFLNLTEEEILENERLWTEENPSKLKNPKDGGASGGADIGLSSIGLGPDPFAGIPDSGQMGEPGADGGANGAPTMAPGGPVGGASAPANLGAGVNSEAPAAG